MVIHCPPESVIWVRAGMSHLCLLKPQTRSPNAGLIYLFTLWLWKKARECFDWIVFLPPLGPPITGSSFHLSSKYFNVLELSPSPFLISIYFFILVISSSLVELLSICKIFLIYICSLDHCFESQIHTSTILPKLYLNINKCLNLPLLKPGLYFPISALSLLLPTIPQSDSCILPFIY